MNYLFIVFIPLTVILISCIISYGNFQNIKTSHNIGLIGLLVALIFNSLVLAFSTLISFPIVYNVLTINLLSLWVQEILIFLFFIYYLSIYSSLTRSHNQQLILGQNFLILGMTLLLFNTENLLILSIFIVAIHFLVDSLYWYGFEQKRSNKLKYSNFMKFLGLVLVLFLDYLIYRWFGDFNISIVKESLESLPVLPKNILFYGFLSLALIVFQNGPLSGVNKKEYFGKSNIFHTRLLFTIVLPAFLIIFTKIIIFMFEPNNIFGLVIIIIGILGYALSLGRILMELNGQNLQKSQNVLKILGYSSIFDFNLYWIIFGLYHLIPNINLDVFCSALTILIGIISVGKSIIWEAINPLLSSCSSYELKTFGKWGRYFPSFSILLVFYIFYLVGPGFPGFHLLQGILEITSFPIPGSLYIQGIKWAIFVVFCIYLLINTIFIATLLGYMFHTKKTLTPTEMPPIEAISIKNYIFGPIFLIGIIIFQIIFTPYINELQSFFI